MVVDFAGGYHNFASIFILRIAPRSHLSNWCHLRIHIASSQVGLRALGGAKSSRLLGVQWGHGKVIIER